jgi:hypothetical protein
MRKSLVALALVLGLPGCNGDGTDSENNPSAPESPAAEATMALVQATTSPVLVPATATGDPALPWRISWVTTVRETAGVAARVDRIIVVLVDAKVVYQGADLGGSPQVAARGSASFNQALSYSLPDGGRLAVVSIVVDLTDTRGNRVEAAAQLRII